MVQGAKVVWSLVTRARVYVCAHAHSVDIGKVSSLMAQSTALPTYGASPRCFC